MPLSFNPLSSTVGRLLFLLLLGIALMAKGHAESAVPSSDGVTANGFRVVTSLRPMGLVLQELARKTPLKVVVLLPSGTTPHQYSLSSGNLKAIHQAQLIVWLGPESEPYLKNALRQRQHLIEWASLDGVKRLPVRDLKDFFPQLAGKGHHHDHEHEHSQFDPHLWFSVDNLLVLASAVVQDISERQPELASQLQKNLTRLQQRLQKLQQQYRAQLAAQGNHQPFLLAHDAYQYLERDLGIAAEAAVSADPEITPGLKTLMKLRQKVKDAGVACVVEDPTVSGPLLDKVVPYSITRASIHPLAWDSEEQTYSKWLESVYQRISRCLAR